jgi:predicted metal-dependent hydrolase
MMLKTIAVIVIDARLEGSHKILPSGKSFNSHTSAGRYPVNETARIGDDILPAMSDCSGTLHPQAREGLRHFNAGEYFEAHEALEAAWKAEEGDAKNLYRGILQIAVAYLHIRRKNYAGAVKVYERSKKWLKGLPAVCKGVEVRQLLIDAEKAFEELQRLGPERIAEFDPALLKAVKWEDRKRIYICDRCGSEMREKNCKVTCPNCGNRFDCSDLNIYFD